MRRLMFALLLANPAGLIAAGMDEAPPRVLMTTSMGEVTIELDREKAPIAVGNFLGYVERGDYDGTIFHRVIPGFMVQGGGHDPDLSLRTEGETIRNEADNGLRNETGTVAMARMSGIDSASRQFFINVNDNTHLDHKETSCTREDIADAEAARERGLYKPLSCANFGYAVFGRVVDGMDVVHAIEIVETASRDGHDDVPVEPVIIESITLLPDGEAQASAGRGVDAGEDEGEPARP